jgi:hypothetical protein
MYHVDDHPKTRSLCTSLAYGDPEGSNAYLGRATFDDRPSLDAATYRDYELGISLSVVGDDAGRFASARTLTKAEPIFRELLLDAFRRRPDALLAWVNDARATAFSEGEAKSRSAIRTVLGL